MPKEKESLQNGKEPKKNQRDRANSSNQAIPSQVARGRGSKEAIQETGGRMGEQIKRGKDQ